MIKTVIAIKNRLRTVLRDREQDTVAARLVRGTSGTAFLKMFDMATVFLTTILLGRFLGVQEFGIYAYAVSWVTLLGVFAKAGIDAVMFRNIAIYHQENDWARIMGMFRFGLLVVSVAGLICAVALAGLAWLLHGDAPSMRDALFLACLLLLLQALLIPLKAIQGGFQQVTYAQLPMFLIIPSTFLLMIVGIYVLSPVTLSGNHAILLRAVAVLIGIFAAIVLLYMGFNKAGRPQSLPRPVYESRQWLASAAPMVLVGSMFVVNSNADILMLGTLVGAEASGIYKAATRGAALVTLSLMIVNVPLQPLIARLYAAGDSIKLQRVLTRCTQIAFIPATMIAAVFILKGEWFLQLFGTDFATDEGGLSLAILSIGQLVNVASGSVAALLIMTKHESYAARALTVSAILNISLNAVLIPIAGLVGAAIATGISTIVWNLLLLAFAIRYLKLNPAVVPLRFSGASGSSL